MTTQPNPTRPVRHDGWTDARREAFLAHLAAGHPVAAACRAVGKSAAGAYARRTAEPAFADAWAAAQEQGAHAVEDSARMRAIAGWLEPVTYRGRMIAVAERFDQRLLLKLLDQHLRREERAERRAEKLTVRAPGPDFP